MYIILYHLSVSTATFKGSCKNEKGIVRSIHCGRTLRKILPRVFTRSSTTCPCLRYHLEMYTEGNLDVYREVRPRLFRGFVENQFLL